LALIDRLVAKLERKLARVQPDLADLEIAIRKQARRMEYVSRVRLSVMELALPAMRNRAPTIEQLLREAFRDLNEQLDRLNAGLRGERLRHRRRAARNATFSVRGTGAVAPQ
jgi:hypothetical protein